MLCFGLDTTFFSYPIWTLDGHRDIVFQISTTYSPSTTQSTMDEAATNGVVSASKPDPYAPIAAALQRWKVPVQELLHKHDDFVLQNVRALNDVKDLRAFRREVETAIAMRDNCS